MSNQRPPGSGVAHPGPEQELPGEQRSRRLALKLPGSRPAVNWATVAGVCLVAVANAVALSHVRLPFLGPAIGLWFLVLQPAYLLYTTRLWRGCSAAEGVGYSVVGVLLLLMLGGLAANTLLPLVGIQRSLGPVPVVAVGDILTASLYYLRRRLPGDSPQWRLIKAIGRRETRVLTGSGLGVALAVMGANRLNNGAGDTVSLVALVVMAATLVLLLLWQADVRDSVTSLTLYAVSLGLLLMTSLRGWYVTGHDIQNEYRVFQLTVAHAHWSMAYYPNAYNACLSITILPTEISQVLHIAHPYVYKVFFQLFFAVCPVLVYSIARRYWSRPISILGALYFIGLPLFFSDMPFLNRQEMGFLFICAAILAITNRDWSLRRRQIVFLAASLGVEVSHYSSMYFFLGILLVAWVTQLVLGVNLRRLRRGADAGGRRRTSWANKTRTIGAGSVLAVIAITFTWGQLVTRTAGSVVTVAQAAIAGLTGGNGTKSGDLANILFSGGAPSVQTVFKNYGEAAFAQRALSPSAYVPTGAVLQYKTPLTNSLVPAPLTAAGHFLAKLGVSPAELNGILRNAAAKDEQLFVLIGFAAFVLVRSLRGRVGREVFSLGVGSMTMLGVMIVLPNLSVDYGVTRAFQQSLIVIAPILVAGSLAAFSPFGQAWALRIAAVVCLGIFVSTTGLLPQVLGGYPAQLSLNNSGEYYDIYYTHPQEASAVGWLGSEPGVLADGVQASFTPSKFAFTAPSQVSGAENVTDIYPSLVRKNSWVIVGYSTMHTGRSTAFYEGDLITYMYPLRFLQNSKNLVYNNGGTEIYK